MMTSDLKPYSAYKDPGVEWLGEVPEHWAVERLKSSVANIVEQNTERRQRDIYLALEHVESWTGRLKSADLEVPSDSQLKRFESDDVLFGKLRPYLAKVTRPANSGLCVGEFLVLRPRNSKFASGYVEQLLRSKPVIDVVDSSTFGAKMPRADWTFIGSMAVVRPSLPEQTAIVRFLDHADRRIQRYIRAKQKLITLLEEQKQAIIHQAVTGQIDVRTGRPYPAYKPSGVEWLGKVPSHWEVRRARYIFREIDRRSPDGSEQHLSMSQSLGLVPSYLVENRTLVSENHAGGKLCRSGDLVLNRLKAHLGVFARAQQSGVISTDYTVLRPNREAKTEYFEQVLRSPSCRGELRTRAKGIVEGFWRLYTDDLYDIYLPLPTVDEQESIIRWIKSISMQAERNAALGDREVALLQEYRTRLIADVVTGKLDVREAAAELPEEDVPGDAEESAEEYTIEKEVTV